MFKGEKTKLSKNDTSKANTYYHLYLLLMTHLFTFQVKYGESFEMAIS